MFFSDRLLEIAYDISINNQHDKHATSMKSITSKFNNIGIEIFHNNILMREMSNIYA